MNEDDDDFAKGARILSEDGKHVGHIMTGHLSQCTLEGCSGQRIAVKWKDGKITKPCTKGLMWDEKRNAWRIS